MPQSAAEFTVTVRHAEVLHWNNYTLNTFTLGLADNVDVYTFPVNARWVDVGGGGEP